MTNPPNPSQQEEREALAKEVYAVLVADNDSLTPETQEYFFGKSPTPLAYRLADYVLQREHRLVVEAQMQPLYVDEHGVIRFKRNKIVEYLLDNGGIDMNDLARLDFSVEDREQFAQLIGYSLSGFSELHYVRDETYERAEAIAAQLASDPKGKGGEG